MSDHELKWTDVKDVAETTFNIWIGQPELRWANRSWEILIERGLSEYDTELDRHRVCLRFASLAALYYDWCLVAWDERGDYLAIWEAVKLFGISPTRIGQLVGETEDFDPYEIDDDLLVTSALEFLEPTFRSEVVDGLLYGYGNQSDLFVSFWNSREHSRDWNESYSAIVNEVTGNKLAAWQWIEERCPNIGE